MEIRKNAYAGTLESSDVFVEVSENPEGRQINIESVVIEQFGEDIKKAVSDTLDKFEVKNALVNLKDRGALESTIKARVETAIRRAAEEG